MNYDRKRPSPRYQELLAQYVAMHAFGEPHLNLPSDKTFGGFSLLPHAAFIESLIDRFEGRSFLDFGCGKGAARALVRVGSQLPALEDLRRITCLGAQALAVYCVTRSNVGV